MRAGVTLLLSILMLLIITTEAKQKKHKKAIRHRFKTPEPVEEIISQLEHDEKQDLRTNVIDLNLQLPMDPCNNVHCGAGKVCQVTETGETQCVCIKSCVDPTDPRRKVCSNFNTTWNSDCSLHQMRCWCQSGNEKCEEEKLAHMHIEYYGECRVMKECTEDEMADFPRRMRDWLFNVMRDLAEREELSPYYLRMEMEAETNLTKRWANAAVWKWCDLEKSRDRAVSRHELFPIRGHLMALEHCIAPFLDSCDIDNDHLITLAEWAKCLQIDEGEIEAECEGVEADEEYDNTE